MKIDSHQHFWVVGKFHYPWLKPELGILYRNYQPEDLAPLLQSAGFEHSIIVQASPSVAETDWLLALADRHEWVAGVVGWLDLESSEFPQQFLRYRKHPKFIGLRPAIEFMPGDDWIENPDVMANLRIVADADFPFDFIVWPRHLPSVVRVLERLPHLRCVIDHLAKPDLKSPPEGLTGNLPVHSEIDPGIHRQDARDTLRQDWASLMRQIAAFHNAHCKLSGLSSGDLHVVQPFVDQVIASFGPERVMYGSDWPVSLRVGSYQQSVDLIRHAAKVVPEQDLFGNTATKFYRLPHNTKGHHASSSTRRT